MSAGACDIVPSQQHDCDVQMRAWQIGLQLECSCELCHRLIVAVLKGERAAEAVVGLRQSRIDAKRFAVLHGGIVRTPFPHERSTEPDERLCESRVRRE